MAVVGCIAAIASCTILVIDCGDKILDVTKRGIKRIESVLGVQNESLVVSSSEIPAESTNSLSEKDDNSSVTSSTNGEDKENIAGDGNVSIKGQGNFAGNNIGNNNSIVIQNQSNTKSDENSQKEEPIKILPKESQEFNDFLIKQNENIRMFANTKVRSQDLSNKHEYGCLIYYNFTNTSDNDIIIDKFTFEARDIKIDYSPVIGFESFDETSSETSISLLCYNEGWGPAHNLSFNLYDDEGILEEFFSKESLKGEVSELKAGETREDIFTLKLNDKIKPIDNEYYISSSYVSYQCDNYQEEVCSIPFGGIILKDDKLQWNWMGGGPPTMYGLQVPVEQDTYVFSKEIAQVIPAHKTVRLPFFFFTDKSASMTFNVKFETTNEDQPVITTKDCSINFFVSSLFPPYELQDAKDEKNFISIEKDEYGELCFPFKTIEEFDDEVGIALPEY